MVNNERVLNVALASLGNPVIEQLKENQYQYWYAGKKTKSEYFSLIDKYIRTGKDWDVIDIERNVLVPRWDSQLQLLKTGGERLKEYLQIIKPFMTSKIESTEALVLLEYIHVELPLVREIDQQVIGMDPARISALLSRLETVSVLKVTPKGTIVPYVAFEILGTKAEEILDDTLENELNRCVFDLIRKMPAVTLGKLLKFTPIDPKKAYDVVARALLDLKKKNLVYIVMDTIRKELVIVPVWYLGNLIGHYPTVLDTGLLSNALISCSQFWEYCSSLEDVDVQIKKLTDLLSHLKAKEGLPMDEFLKFEPQYTTTIWSLRNNGVVKTDGERLLLGKGNEKVLEVLLQVLNSAYYASSWDGRLSTIPDVSMMLSDIGMSYKQLESYIEEHLKKSDIKKYVALTE
jgi:hypothetical protein